MPRAPGTFGCEQQAHELLAMAGGVVLTDGWLVVHGWELAKYVEERVIFEIRWWDVCEHGTRLRPLELRRSRRGESRRLVSGKKKNNT